MKEKIKKNGLLHAFYSFFNTIIKGYKIYKINMVMNAKYI